MQTRITAALAQTDHGKEAEAILRSCVHCGFCTATCPTYQLLGDERDGPRGRIYLIKQVLEGEQPSRETQLHLDRCLTCRSCETTCPSGVQYGRLLDIGRAEIDKQVTRPWSEKMLRYLLRHTVPYPRRMKLLLRTGNTFKALLPASIKSHLVPIPKVTAFPQREHPRKMLVLGGCVQSIASPQTNIATTKVLNKLGIQLINVNEAGCCGALSHHLSAQEQTLNHIKQNIDAWWPYIEAGAEAIISTASGCGTMLEDYGHLLRHDERYAEKAAKVSAMSCDIAEIIAEEDLSQWQYSGDGISVAFHCPCSLQHGQQLYGTVEAILKRIGYHLTPVADGHLCCGSAGSYSLLQPELSQQLKANKVKALQADNPDRIVTANIGCQMHLSEPNQPISHWIELLAEVLDV